MSDDKKCQEKRRALMEQQRRWMKERERHNASPSLSHAPPSDSSRVSLSASATAPVPTSTHRGAYSGSGSTGNDADEQLSHRIREEIARELRGGNLLLQQQMISRSSSVSGSDSGTDKKQLEEYVVQTEAQTHTCKICFEIMTSPVRTPMILYPCGHTFCKDCMNKHVNRISTQSSTSESGGSSSGKATCPYCRYCSLHCLNVYIK